MCTLRLFLLLGLCCRLYALPMQADAELNTCELQLTKYRKFILQAILSFEDVCDAYNARPSPAEVPTTLTDALLFRHYQPPTQSQRTEIWAFFKLLMAQFNDVEFTNIIRDAVIERCRIKSQLQHDEKRNSVVLGKKQRFHSWGGKRSGGTVDANGAAAAPAATLLLSDGLGLEHSYY